MNVHACTRLRACASVHVRTCKHECVCLRACERERPRALAFLRRLHCPLVPQRLTQEVTSHFCVQTRRGSTPWTGTATSGSVLTLMLERPPVRSASFTTLASRTRSARCGTLLIAPTTPASATCWGRTEGDGLYAPVVAEHQAQWHRRAGDE